MADITNITEADLINVVSECFPYDGEDERSDDRGRFVDMIRNSDDVIAHIVACETGQYSGEPFSPIDDLLAMYEERYKDGVKCTDRERRDIVAVYNEIWYHAESYMRNKENISR